MSKQINAQRITRLKAIAMLEALPGDEIAGVVFVSRSSAPHVCRMSFRKGVRKHLKGGARPYLPASHGLMGVAEVINLATALKEYRQSAQHAIDTLEPLVADANGALTRAQVALAGKNTKKNREAVRIKRNALDALNSKLAHANLVLSDHKAALRTEILQRIENRQTEIAELEESLKARPGDQALESKLAQGRSRLSKEREYLASPEQSLLSRYRNINLTGLLELTIGGKVYKVTTPPQPPLPAGA
jgi:hypothetical protein